MHRTVFALAVFALAVFALSVFTLVVVSPGPSAVGANPARLFAAGANSSDNAAKVSGGAHPGSDAAEPPE